MKKRSEVEIKDTWKLEDMVASDSQWEQLFEEASSKVKQYADYRGRLDESADTLYACLKFDDEISRETELLYVYSRMRSDQDTADQRYQDMFSRAQSLSYKASEYSSYIVPEILSIPEEKLDAYMKADNGISHFKRALEMVLNKREHTLSGEMEELLAQSYDATQGASQIFTMFNNADVKFPVITGENGEAVQITHGNYISLMENQDRRIRKDAFEGLYSVYASTPTPWRLHFPPISSRPCSMQGRRSMNPADSTTWLGMRCRNWSMTTLSGRYGITFQSSTAMPGCEGNCWAWMSFICMTCTCPWWLNMTAAIPMRRPSPL